MDLWKEKNVLRISDERIEELGKEKVEVEEINTDMAPKSERIINGDDIVGISGERAYAETWKELFDNYFHKGYILHEINNIRTILDCPRNNDFPTVLEREGKYYICDDGFHRLTLCKIMKIESVRVLLYTDEEE